MTPPPLSAALDTFNSTDLGQVLAAAGVADVPKAKHERVRLWLTLVGDPERIQRALARLTPVAQRALEMLQNAGGEVRTDRFRSLLVRLGVVSGEEEPSYGYGYGYGRSSSKPAKKDESGLPSFSQVRNELLRSGLIWTHTLRENQPGNAKIGLEGGRFLYIPDEVAKHLPPPRVKEYPVPELAQTLEGSARTCQRDLYLVWSAARESPLQLTNTGLMRVSDLKRVASQLLLAETVATGTKESEYRRIFFLRQLATALGTLKHNTPANQLQAHPSPAFISKAPAERVQLSLQQWRDGTWWNELWATLSDSHTTSAVALTSPAPAQVAVARRTVLETLAMLAGKAERKQHTQTPWVPLDGISDFLRERDEEFLVERSTAAKRGGSYGYYSASFYSPYEYNRLGWSWPGYQRNEEAGWKAVERVFIETVLSEGLYWLGLVDLGYAEPVTPVGGAAPGGLAAVRLTDMGRWLLLNGPAPEIPEESGRVVVQPNFRIFAFDPISDAVLARLDSFASRQNAERAIEYELTRETLYRAQLAGQSAASIQAWLEEVTGAPLPQNVARSLEEWQAAFERITVRSRVGWLEAATPELVDALLRDRSWSKTAIIKRATPTGLIVRADRIDELEQALLAAGELPMRNSDPETSRQASITVDEAGQIGFLHSTPSLYVYGYLRAFCEQSGSGWQITARSVAQAAAAGLDAAAILDHLAAMAVGGVPAALQARIKAWSQHYGAALVQTLTLVQFRDQDVLDELRADPLLAGYLTVFKPEDKLGLAVVAPEDLAAVTALLVERGVDVRS